MRHRLAALTGTGALLTAGLVSVATPAFAAGVCGVPVVVGPTTTITCAAGGTGSITVPDNVSSATVTLDGAGGGPAADGTPGGKGAHLVATIPVAPGQSYNVAVGVHGVTSPANPTIGIPGTGGGLVAVTTNTNAPLLTAGSGGGAGGPGVGSPAFPGSPGGDSGSAGGDGNGVVPDAQGGTGGSPGTATGGGAAGTGGVGATNTGVSGSPGAFPNGLGGGVTQSVPVTTGAGGRGGAGYGGGGRGGAGGRNGNTGGGGGGGGGGSSLATGTNITLTDGANAGDGLVVFVFTQNTPTVTSVTPNSGPVAGGDLVTITGTDLTGSTVDFGGVPATGVTCTATSCTVSTPAHAAGTVDVRVTTPGGTSPVTAADQYTYLPPPAADIDVNLTAQPHLGILVPYLTYTLTAHNTGPSAVTSATLTATLPAGATATGLSAGCTVASTTVTCTYGPIANATSVNKTFQVPLHLLSLGHVTVTGTRTASAPADPNPANDTASATCTVISILLATCP
ncbi:hypothetical protein GCM10010371_34510 [Streptomyces subrutilus]|uniref:IPT/TIG domain-containing protein n=2 Tax=Streptomyces subrutilus TaxID=36818 RepID=A0A918QVM6_9ACTN|nr:IPT/TIG domain-containing protein [Streptomyces subrutilus]GGZ71915.1 hypothetical protein GCM10010371_34510 [Streptomyces subrutilus]